MIIIHLFKLEKSSGKYHGILEFHYVLSICMYLTDAKTVSNIF